MYGIDINSFVRQAKKLTDQIAKRKEELAQETVEGTAGDGLVSVVAACNQEIKSIKIQPKAIEDLALLEDLVTAAVNAALTKSKQQQTTELEKITKGTPIPGLF